MILAKSSQLKDGRWLLKPARFCPKFRDVARQYPGMVWDKKLFGWTGYVDSMQMVMNKLSEGGIAKVVGDLPSTHTVLSLSVPDLDSLRPYQQDGLQFLLTNACEGVILADDTGLGKTRTALFSIREFGMPCVVVCPAVVKRVWAREAQKIGLEVTVLEGTKPPENVRISPSDGIVVLNYDIAYAWLPVLKGAKTVVFDEAHNLINAKSRRSQSCKEIAHSAKNRMALTATPMTGRAKELWNVVDTVSPNRFGSFFGYAMKYCNASKELIKTRNGEEKQVWNFNGASHLDELNLRLKKFMLRRTKKEVALQLPPKTRQIIEVDVPLDTSPRDWNLSDTRSVRMALNISAKAKINHAVNLAMDHMAAGSSVVLFAHERAVARELKDTFAEKGRDVYIATGEDSANKRDDTAQKAKADTPCALVVTTHSMGEGIDLTFADIGIIVELDYVPAKIIQLEGRQHRPGQVHNVLLQYLIGIGTIDELVRNAVLGKLEVIDKVIGSDDTLKADLANTNEEEALNDLREMLLKMGEEYT